MATSSTVSIGNLREPSRVLFERHRSTSALRFKKSPLVKCVELDYTEELQELLRQDSDSSSSVHGQSDFSQETLDEALLCAAQLGKAHACTILCRAGADCNAREGEKKFEERYGNSRAVLTMEQAQSDLWSRRHSALGGSPLHLAAEGGFTEVATVLQEHEACVNVVDQRGYTPLMLACMRRGCNDLVIMLANAKGCKVDLKDNIIGRTALHYAAQSGDPDNVNTLLIAGANFDMGDDQQNTSLMLSCCTHPFSQLSWPPQQEIYCVRALLDRGASVNILNAQGYSALSYAVLAGRHDLVQLLLENDAIVHAHALAHAVTELRDSELVAHLLKPCRHTLNDNFLCALLLAVLSNSISAWSLNNQAQRSATHNISRELIKAVSDPSTFTDVSSMPVEEMAKEFGEEFIDVYDTAEHQTLQKYGFLGFALLKGKYSVARMLYIAGCRKQLPRMREKAEAVEMAQGDNYLQTWLAPALNNVDEEKETLEKQLTYSPALLDEIELHDASVNDCALDDCYARREDARALLARGFTIYSD